MAIFSAHQKQGSINQVEIKILGASPLAERETFAYSESEVFRAVLIDSLNVFSHILDLDFLHSYQSYSHFHAYLLLKQKIHLTKIPHPTTVSSHTDIF